MDYLITFLEGFISFISPCMLPMLPIYISYFAAGNGKKHRTFLRALFFVLGFTIVFCLLGVFAGAAGSFLQAHKRLVDIVCGALVIVFALSYLDVFHLPFFRGIKDGTTITGVFSAFVFGMIYALCLTPCVGAFLGAALMLASVAATAWRGFLLLLCYSLGLGIPFVLSAVLIDRLENAFKFIKSHYHVINLVCGIFLLIVGVMMSFGMLGRVLAIFS